MKLSDLHRLCRNIQTNIEMLSAFPDRQIEPAKKLQAEIKSDWKTLAKEYEAFISDTHAPSP